MTPNLTRKEALECVGPGWAKLINEVYDLIEEEPKGGRPAVVQCKEKFGGLRAYITNGSDKLYNAIYKIESRSKAICEFCGKPGKITTIRGWDVTTCKKCLALKQKEQEKVLYREK
jgi:hypothetical protein